MDNEDTNVSTDETTDSTIIKDDVGRNEQASQPTQQTDLGKIINDLWRRGREEARRRRRT